MSVVDTIKFNKRNSKMVAHRGLFVAERENSLPAFKDAATRTHVGIECDIHVTTDKKFVVIHDETTGRVSNTSINVEKSDYETVRKVVLNSFYPGKTDFTPEDMRVPSYEEYIDVCKAGGKIAVTELKNHFELDDIKLLIDELKRLDYLDGVIFISFDLENMINLRALLPDAKLQYLTSAYSDEILATLDKYGFDLDIYYKSLTKENVDEIHAHGHEINVWTCDTAEEGERLAEWGVDYITSNYLE